MHQQAEPIAAATIDRKLRHSLGLARAALYWERLWPLVLPPVAVASLFVSLALMEVLPALPGWLHGLALAGFAGAVAYLTWRVPLRFVAPSLDDARRRLERDSGLAHRPLAALADQPVGDGADPVSAALWEAHRRRMAGMVGVMRVAWPEPGMAARDPYGWRAAALLLLVIAFTMGGHDWRRRLDSAVSPALETPGMAPDMVEVWLTPPSYTGAPPVLLRLDDQQGDTPAMVPAGSSVLSVLTGGWGDARLVIDGVETPFERQADGNQRVETQMETGRSLTITQGRRQVAEWDIRVVPDAVPSIAFSQPPELGERGRLRFDLTASDDYGLTQARIDARRIEDAGDGKVLTVTLPLAGGRKRNAEISSWHDLTAHPWAGLPVALIPVARDALGQEGAGEPMIVVLPEREFSHPVARALIEQRRLVTEDIANAIHAAAILQRITAEPQLFDGDLKVFLALRTARAVLLRGPQTDVAEVQELLWSAALRIEEGDLAESERALEAARQALENALAEDASAAEMERLLDEFQEALARYLDALSQRMAETGQPPPPGMAPADRVVTDEDLAHMLDSMRQMAETGAREALRQMLNDMSSMLSNLQTQPQAQPSPEALRALDDLEALTRRQQELLDESFRESQRGEARQGDEGEGGAGQGGGAPSGARGGSGGTSGDPARGDPAFAARSQQGVQRGLDDVMKRLESGLGATPGTLPEASRAMNDAAALLSEGQWGDAAEAQSEAVQRMRDAGREAASQMGAAGTGSSGLVPRDPLGRPMTGAGHGDDGTTAIPALPDTQRARAILDELRRRAGESGRPEPERDYLKRLLKQF